MTIISLELVFHILQGFCALPSLDGYMSEKLVEI